MESSDKSVQYLLQSQEIFEEMFNIVEDFRIDQDKFVAAQLRNSFDNDTIEIALRKAAGLIPANEFDNFLKKFSEAITNKTGQKVNFCTKRLSSVEEDAHSIQFDVSKILQERNKVTCDKIAKRIAQLLVYSLSLNGFTTSSMNYGLFNARHSLVDDLPHFKLSDKFEDFGFSFDVASFKGCLLSLDIVLYEKITKRQIIDTIIKHDELKKFFLFSDIDRGARINGSTEAHIHNKILINNIVFSDEQTTKKRISGSLVHFNLWFDWENIKLPSIPVSQLEKLSNFENNDDLDTPELEIPKTIAETNNSLVTDLETPHLNKKINVGINGASGRIGISLFRLIFKNPNLELKKIVVNDKDLAKGGADAQRRLLDLWFFDEIYGTLIPNACASCLQVKKSSIFDNEVVESQEKFVEDQKITMVDGENNLFVIFSNGEPHKLLYTIEFWKDNSKIVVRNAQNETIIDCKIIPRGNTPSDLVWDDITDPEDHLYLPEIIFEATGNFTDFDVVSSHLSQHTELVILTCPGSNDPEWEERTFVHGCNTQSFEKKIQEISVISGASCTTNALANPIKVINDSYGILAANFCSLHSVTNSQKILPKQDPKNDAMLFNPNLTSTGATKSLPLIGIVDKRTKEPIPVEGFSCRVPVPIGSCISLTMVTDQPVRGAEAMNKLLEAASHGCMKGLLVVDSNCYSSLDIMRFKGPAAVVNPNYTQVNNFIGPDGKEHSRVTIQIFYDNENGYSSQLLRIPIQFRLTQMQQKKSVVSRIEQELKEIGSGGYKDSFVFSDVHGAGDKQFIMLCKLMHLDQVHEFSQKIQKIEDEYTKFCAATEEKNKSKLCELKTKKLQSLIQSAFAQTSFSQLIKQKFNLKDDIPEQEFKKIVKEKYSWLNFAFLGDIGDRGPFSIWVYKQLEELQALGILSISAIGNHDLWMMMNLLCWHLPLTEDFNFHDKKLKKCVFKTFFTKPQIRELVKENLIIFHDEDSQVEITTNEPFMISKKLEGNVVGLTTDFVLQQFGTFAPGEIAMIMKMGTENSSKEATKEELLEIRKMFWTKKLFWFNNLQTAWQKREDIKLLNRNAAATPSSPGYTKITVNYDKVAQRVGELFDIVKSTIEKESVEDSLWNSFRGQYFGTDVNTGFRAVGKMSLKWWKEQKVLLQKAIDRLNEHPLKPAFIEAWRELNYYVGVTIENLEEEYAMRLNSEDALVYRVFANIHYTNYESSEWWALDWSSHPGWGPSFFKDETDRIKAEKQAKNEKFVAETDTIDESNHLRNKNFMEMTDFIRRNFKLFEITNTNDLHLHGLLPIVSYRKKDGKTSQTFGFTYRNVKYYGKSLFEGLRILENDIRRGNNLREAFDLINNWYADKTTITKPLHLDKIQKSLKEVLESIGLKGRIFLGHMPFSDKLYLRNKGYKIIGDNLVFCDDGLSPAYVYSGGGRLSVLNRSISKLNCILGEATVEKLSEKQIISKKFNPFADYVKLEVNLQELNKSIVLEDLTAEENTRIIQSLQKFFDDSNPAICVFGFENRDSVKPILNPDIFPELKNGDGLRVKDGTVVVLAETVVGSVLDTLPVELKNMPDLKSAEVAKGAKIRVQQKTKTKVSKIKNRIRLPIGTEICFGGENLTNFVGTCKEEVEIELNNSPSIKMEDGIVIRASDDLKFETSKVKVSVEEFFKKGLIAESEFLHSLNN